MNARTSAGIVAARSIDVERLLWGGLLASIEFHNSTLLVTPRLLALCREGTQGWAVGTIKVYVRYSRGSDFSGSCYYADRRIFVNLGRHLVYPYWMETHLARAKATGKFWYKPSCAVELRNGYHLVMFVFMHELYHLLVKRARRNTRQKESMCDRFAARFVVDRFGVAVRGPDGRAMPRDCWDFQDLEGFVAAARDRRAATRPRHPTTTASSPRDREQWLLFPI